MLFVYNKFHHDFTTIFLKNDHFTTDYN